MNVISPQPSTVTWKCESVGCEAGQDDSFAVDSAASSGSLIPLQYTDDYRNSVPEGDTLTGLRIRCPAGSTLRSSSAPSSDLASQVVVDASLVCTGDRLVPDGKYIDLFCHAECPAGAS